MRKIEEHRRGYADQAWLVFLDRLHDLIVRHLRSEKPHVPAIGLEHICHHVRAELVQFALDTCHYRVAMLPIRDVQVEIEVGYDELRDRRRHVLCGNGYLVQLPPPSHFILSSLQQPGVDIGY